MKSVMTSRHSEHRPDKGPRLVDVDRVAGLGNNRDLRRREQRVHTLGNLAVARIPFADHEQYALFQIGQGGPERSLLPGAHAAQTVGQAERRILKTLGRLLAAVDVGNMGCQCQKRQALPFGDEGFDAVSNDALSQSRIAFDPPAALEIILDASRGAFENERVLPGSGACTAKWSATRPPIE